MGIKDVKWKGASLKQDASNRLVTDNEKTTWNNKANNSHTHTKSQVGLGNVDNTADKDKSVNYANSSGIPQGFASRLSNQTWGNQNGTPITDWHTTNGGDIAFRDNDGQINVITDGFFYQNEGANKVLDEQNYSDYASPKNHTHNYAGSSSAGGSATSAVKLDTVTAGSATQPVYFSGGKPVACSYTLGKSVPSNAVFTDTNTWRPLGTTADSACAGNDSRLSNARPASDVYAWAKASSKPSYSWSEITNKPSTFNPSSHNHDSSYIPFSGSIISNPNTEKFSISKALSGYLLFANTGDTNGVAAGIGGVNGANDGWSVRGYQTAYNSGCLEISVGDDGDEGIYVRQYTSAQYKLPFMNKAGSASGLNYREIVLMEPNTGNSIFPGTVTAKTFKGTLSGNASSASSVAWSGVSGKPSTFTPSSHTHNYAGSSSVGGSANSAVKLDTSTAGSATQPVYFSGGKPVACSYTLGKSVPSNAVFTDTDTWRPLGTTANTACAGNDSRLSNSRPASDVYSWAKAKSKPSYSWSEIGSKPSTFTPSSHNHDYLTLYGGRPVNINFNTSTNGTGAMFHFVATSSTTTGKPPEDSNVLQLNWDNNGGYDSQLSITNCDGHMYFRGQSAGKWNNWKTVIDSSNIGSQSVNYANSAGGVAWGNVSGKPSTFTPSSHTHTKSQVGLGNVDNTADSAKSVKYATSAGSATTASQLMLGSRATTFNWNGQGGQPEWLFGSNESNITGGSTSNVYVYNPSNFYVAHANESSTLGITANPTNSNNLDTPLNFAQHSVSAYFITTNGQVTDQPSTYGMLLNVGWPGSDCHQIWMNQPGGRIYQRGGNSAGWSGSWHRILCDDDIIETAYYYGADDVLLYTPNESAIRFNGGTPWGIAKLPNSLQVVNGEGSKFRFQNSYCYCDAGFYSKGIFNTTSSSTANLHIDSNGLIRRIGSASKYKLDIKPLEEDSSYPYKLLNLQPKQWFDKGETERYAELLSKEYNGEEMDEESRVVAENSNIDSYYGLIAEDLEATGLEKFCYYGKENTDGKKEVEGIMYDRIPILMIPILKDLVEYVKTTYPLIKDSIKDKDAASKVSSIIDRMNSINDSTMVNTTYKVDNTEK